MIRVKPDTDFVRLFRAAKEARGEIWFQTPQGERLNMKSLLCQYVILAAAEDEENILWNDAEIICDDDEDAAKFAAIS